MAAPVYTDIQLTTSEERSSKGDAEYILYRHLPKMAKVLDISNLRIYLRGEEFLSDDDMAKLEPNPPHYVGGRVTEILASLIKQKGDRGLEKFMAALRRSVKEDNHLGHEELLETLENELYDQGSGRNTSIRQQEAHAGEREGKKEEVEKETDMVVGVEVQSSETELVREDLKSDEKQKGRCIYVCACIGLGILEVLLLVFGILLLCIGTVSTDSSSSLFCETEEISIICLYHGALLCVSAITLPLSLIGQYWEQNRDHYWDYLLRIRCYLRSTVIIMMFIPFVFFIFLVFVFLVGIIGEIYFVIGAPQKLYPQFAHFNATVVSNNGTIYCSPTAFYTAFTTIVCLHIVTGIVVLVSIVVGCVYILIIFVNWLVPSHTIYFP